MFKCHLERFHLSGSVSEPACKPDAESPANLDTSLRHFRANMLERLLKCTFESTMLSGLLSGLTNQWLPCQCSWGFYSCVCAC